MSSIFVIAYASPQANVVSTIKLYYTEYRPVDPIPSQDFNPPSYRPLYLVPQFNILQALRQNTANDKSSSAVETNVHFLGKFTQPQHFVSKDLRQQNDWASTNIPVVHETPPHFIGNFTSPTFQIIPPFSGAVDQSSSALETNVHFVPKFTDVKFNSPQYLYRHQDWTTPGFGPGPGNPHFIGKFVQPQFSFLRPFSTPQDLSGTAPSTNVHFVPRFYPVQFTILQGLRSGLAVDVSSTGLETNTHFIPKHTPAQHFVVRLLREQQDWASTTLVSVVEAQPHFIAKFTAPLFTRFNYNLVPEDLGSSAQETNVHFLGKFRAVLFTPVPGLYWETAQDLSGTPPVPPQPPPTFPAIYYILEDMYVNGFYLQAGTFQSTQDLGGVLPVNWTPNPNVDPVNANAVAAYTAAGYRPRGLTRTQWTTLPVAAPQYNWRLVNGLWTLVKGPGSSSQP